MKRVLQRTGLAFVLAWFTFTAGCDVPGPDNTITLTADKDLNFQFSSGNGATREMTLTSNESIDVSDVLQSQNFQKTAITSATIDQATVEIIFPGTVPIGFLSEARLSFAATGLTTTQVASQVVFPQGASDKTVTLNIDATKDITSFVKAASFNGKLFLAAQTLQTNKQYEIQARLRLLVRVQF